MNQKITVIYFVARNAHCRLLITLFLGLRTCSLSIDCPGVYYLDEIFLIYYRDTSHSKQKNISEWINITFFLTFPQSTVPCARNGNVSNNQPYYWIMIKWIIKILYGLAENTSKSFTSYYSNLSFIRWFEIMEKEKTFFFDCGMMVGKKQEQVLSLASRDFEKFFSFTIKTSLPTHAWMYDWFPKVFFKKPFHLLKDFTNCSFSSWIFGKAFFQICSFVRWPLAWCYQLPLYFAPKRKAVKILFPLNW